MNGHDPTAGGAEPAAASPADAGQPDELLVRWLQAAAGGDQDAFAHLYDATSARLYGLVIRVVRNPAQAQEVTQDVFLEIWRTAARFEPVLGSAISWMLTIAHRKSVDRVRSAEASSRREVTHEEKERDIEHDSTSEAVVTGLEAQRVRRALAQLTEAQRSAIELAYFGGYTHREVATMLDLPVGTAKTRIRDGLIRLRDAMGGKA